MVGLFKFKEAVWNLITSLIIWTNGGKLLFSTLYEGNAPTDINSIIFLMAVIKFLIAKMLGNLPLFFNA